MIEPNQGKYYKIKYIGGNLFSNHIYETYGSFIRKSKMNNYIFAVDLENENKYFILNVEKENIIESIDNKDIDIINIYQIDFYIEKCKTFFTTSINNQSHRGYIDYYTIDNFMHEFYKPETGEGYLEALSKWNSELKLSNSLQEN